MNDETTWTVSTSRLIKHTGLIAALAMALSACASDSNMRRSAAPVNEVAVGEPGDVRAETLASAMLRVGFSADEVLTLGPSVRRSLVLSGGAEARRQGELIALFSHAQGRLYVTSTRTGTFVLDV